jgi:hypothetical protein
MESSRSTPVQCAQELASRSPDRCAHGHGDQTAGVSFLRSLRPIAVACALIAVVSFSTASTSRASEAASAQCFNTSTKLGALPDGSLMVIGELGNNVIGGEQDFRYPYTVAVATRLRANGNVDPLFVVGGTARLATNSANGITDVAAMADGSIVISDALANSLTKLLPDGSVDRAYTQAATEVLGSLGLRRIAFDLEVDAADRVVFVSDDESLDSVLVRLDRSGSADVTFATQGRLGVASKFDRLSGPRVVMAPNAIFVASAPSLAKSVEVRRYDGNGTLDTGFGTNGVVAINWTGATATGRTTFDYTDKGLVLSSELLRFGSLRVGAVRLSLDGTIDATFGTRGRLDLGDNQQIVAVSPSGRFIARVGRGITAELSTTFVGYGPNGRLDRKFGRRGTVSLKGKLVPGPGLSIAASADNSFVFAGTSTTPDNDNIATFQYVDATIARIDQLGKFSGLDGDGVVSIDTGAQCQAPILIDDCEQAVPARMCIEPTEEPLGY